MNIDMDMDMDMNKEMDSDTTIINYNYTGVLGQFNTLFLNQQRNIGN
jgi:hypothetical protein